MFWDCGSSRWALEDGPLIMGIVNATPDSFSDGYPSLKAALDHAVSLIEAGAHILDIGGESTRPGSSSVSLEEELRRTLPLIRELRKISDIPLSIDTQKAAVAQVVLDEGVAIINHVSASLDFESMLPVLASYKAGYVAMHMRDRPKTMQENPAYADPVAEVTESLTKVGSAAAALGIDSERILYDPGIGFGKTLAHNLALMRALPAMKVALARPLLLGISRKSWLQHLLGDDLGDLAERDAHTALTTTQLNHPAVLCHRVHNVGLVSRALKVSRALSAGPIGNNA